MKFLEFSGCIRVAGFAKYLYEVYWQLRHTQHCELLTFDVLTLVSLLCCGMLCC